MSVRTTRSPVREVPFVDLAPAHRELKARIVAAVSDLVDSGAFLDGPEIAEFENAFAAYCGARACIGLANGTDALRLALLAAGIAPGDEVVVPAMTFVATFEAVSQAGGVPVVVDVSEDDYCLGVEAATAAITRRTRFVVPVHLYGQMADMRSLSAFAWEHDLTLLEDACQAHGATRDGISAGAGGAAAAFSFYPSKNLGAFGDAGAVTTGDPEIAAILRALRHHGQSVKGVHELEGWTSRLDTIQAIVLLEKLALLDRWNAERRAAAAFYLEALADVGDLGLPPVAAGSDPVWHVFVIRTGSARALADFLRERGVATGRHYPGCPHEQPAFSWVNPRNARFPIAEALAHDSMSLPLFPGITGSQLDTVASAISDFFRR